MPPRISELIGLLNAVPSSPGLLGRQQPTGMLGANPAVTRAHQQMGQTQLQGLLSQVFRENPTLRGAPVSVMDSRFTKGMQDGRQIETYPPEERDNPIPGRWTLEAFNPQLSHGDLKNAVFGEFLHYLPQNDPKYRDWKAQYTAARSPEQIGVDERAYTRGQNEYGENRPYSEWLDRSRTDQAMGGYLAPVNGGWPVESYTPEQIGLFGDITDYLKGVEPGRHLPRPGWRGSPQNAASDGQPNKLPYEHTTGEQHLWDHHLFNFRNVGSGGTKNPDGSISTVRNLVTSVDGRHYVIPTVWNGKILSNQEAVARAKQKGWDYWPSYSTLAEADAAYDKMHSVMEYGMGYNSPESANKRMMRARRLAGGI
jgi:hypothetical protein